MDPTLALREVKALLDAIEHGELFAGAPDDPFQRQRYETGVSLLALAHRIAALGVGDAEREPDQVTVTLFERPRRDARTEPS
jgi:hypothetical protein